MAVEALECRRLLSHQQHGAAAAALTPLVNVAITTNPGVQQAPSVAVDPGDPRHVVVAYMDRSLVTSGYAGIGVATSHDGGVTWSRGAVPLPAGFDQGAADPIVHFDAAGHVYVSFMAATFIGPKPGLTNPDGKQPATQVRSRTLGFQANNGIFVARSDDGGQTWGAAAPVTEHLYDGSNPVPFEIIPDLAIDTFATLPDGRPNPNYGNLYETWSRYYPPGQFPNEPDSTGGSTAMLAVSRDGGATWQTELQAAKGGGTPVTVLRDSIFTGTGAPAGLGAANWVHVAVGAGGVVYVAYYDFGNFGVLHSTNGGATFDVADPVSGHNFVFGTLGVYNADNGGSPSNSFRTQVVRSIAADPVRPGDVYVVEGVEVDDAAGAVLDFSDVYYARSTDYGVTWTTGATVGDVKGPVLNDDNGAQKATGAASDVVASQVMPHIVADANGNLAVIWYDTRHDPAGHDLDVFGTASVDGGLTFAPNYRVTNTPFDANAGQFTDAIGQIDPYIGDSIGLAAADGFVYAAWTDTRNGNQDVYFSRYALSPAPAPPNDRYESNDTPATATNLGAVVQRTLPRLVAPAGDEDWFRVTATATGPLTVNADLTSGSAVSLEIRDATGAQVLASGSTAMTSRGRITGQVAALAATSGRTYLVRVVHAGNTAAADPYALRVQSLTENLGRSVGGSRAGVLNPSDHAYYLLTAAAAGTIRVRLTPVGGAVSSGMVMELVDPKTLNVLATSSVDGSGVQSASVEVAEGAQVLIHVAGGTGAAQAFSLDYVNVDRFASTGGRSLLFPAGAGPSQLVTADFNGDGKLDVAVTDGLANTLSVLLGNGDGTFQAPRQFPLGAFVAGSSFTLQPMTLFRRALVAADFNGDGIPDLAVTNNDSGDVSILLGRGDGTFQPQRRFDATAEPFAIAAGDLNHDGIADLAVVDNVHGRVSVSVLIGRGDGTFRHEHSVATTLTTAFGTTDVRIADVNGDGNADLIVTGGQDQKTHLLLGSGDGTTFTRGTVVLGAGPALLVADLNGDGIPDLVNANYNNDNVTFALGDGRGGFQSPVAVFGGQAPDDVALADVGSAVTLPDGSTVLGPPDGHPDILVSASGVSLTAYPTGPAGAFVLPALYDSGGHFTGFATGVPLAPGQQPQSIVSGDFDGDGATDVAFVDADGVHVITGIPIHLQVNDTAQTARDLGTVVHLVQPAQTITPDHEDAWYALTVPTEAAGGSRDEVIDFSGGFRDESGAGLTMTVSDESGHVLGSGERFRVTARQGARLLLHVFGAATRGQPSSAPRGIGVYALDIDVLPQVVSIEAQPVEPARDGSAGGATSSLVLTFQGDRLDPLAASNPANYRVTWLGPSGAAGSPEARVIGLTTAQGVQPVVYNPGANVDVTTGRTYPTAVRQTVTLVFDQALPAGSYRVDVAPDVQSAAFNQAESAALGVAGPPGAAHPVVSVGRQRQIVTGSSVAAQDLVTSAGGSSDFSAFAHGTPLLTQLQGDLSAMLDQSLSGQKGDANLITANLLDQIRARLAPAASTPLLAIFLDPVSFDVADPGDQRAAYSLRTGDLSNAIPNAFIAVASNVEVLAIPAISGTFVLNVDDVPAGARAGAVIFGGAEPQLTSLTSAIRSGTRQFEFEVPELQRGDDEGGVGGVGTTNIPAVFGRSVALYGPGRPSDSDVLNVSSATAAATPSLASTAAPLPPIQVVGHEYYAISAPVGASGLSVEVIWVGKALAPLFDLAGVSAESVIDWIEGARPSAEVAPTGSDSGPAAPGATDPARRPRPSPAPDAGRHPHATGPAMEPAASNPAEPTAAKTAATKQPAGTPARRIALRGLLVLTGGNAVHSVISACRRLRHRVHRRRRTARSTAAHTAD